MHQLRTCIYFIASLLIANPVYAAYEPMPPAFGTTHFIVGMPITTQQPLLPNQPIARNEGRIAHIFFSPDDKVSHHLIEFINQETRSIKIAIFLFTHEQITQALLNAHQRGVAIEIVVDPKHMYDKFSRIEHLCKNGICVFIFNPKYTDSAGVGLMHNKFAIFGDQELVWTGSFNFTNAACVCNQEHVVVLQGASAVQRFTQQFECLKGRCTRYMHKTTPKRTDTETLRKES